MKEVLVPSEMDGLQHVPPWCTKIDISAAGEAAVSSLGPARQVEINSVESTKHEKQKRMKHMF